MRVMERSKGFTRGHHLFGLRATFPLLETSENSLERGLRDCKLEGLGCWVYGTACPWAACLWETAFRSAGWTWGTHVVSVCVFLLVAALGGHMWPPSWLHASWCTWGALALLCFHAIGSTWGYGSWFLGPCLTSASAPPHPIW